MATPEAPLKERCNWRSSLIKLLTSGMEQHLSSEGPISQGNLPHANTHRKVFEMIDCPHLRGTERAIAMQDMAVDGALKARMSNEARKDDDASRCMQSALRSTDT